MRLTLAVFGISYAYCTCETFRCSPVYWENISLMSFYRQIAVERSPNEHKVNVTKESTFFLHINTVSVPVSNRSELLC